MNKLFSYKFLTALLLWYLLPSPFTEGTGTRLCAQVQERVVNPVIDYARTPQQYYIGLI